MYLSVFRSNLKLQSNKITMSHLTNRRQFLRATTGSAASVFAAGGLSAQGQQSSEGKRAAIPDSGAATMESTGVARKFWTDPGIAAWRPGPWRKVHIEYHNSRHVPKLGERFNADEFGDVFVKARVTGATVFAKDMYGYCYYPSSLGPMHPSLSFDILGAQMKALRKRKIQVLAYYMTTLNPQLAGKHPEWLSARRSQESAASVDREYNPWDWPF